MTHSDEQLAVALQEIGCEFEDNELAYLAITSKIESPFRDQLAYHLHKRHAGAGYMIAREWTPPDQKFRIDLAVFGPCGQPNCFVELKAMYTYDALGNSERFQKLTFADEEKVRAHAPPETTVYSLLLATHLSDAIEHRYERIIKYAKPVNRALNSHGGDAGVRQKAISAVAVKLGSRNLVKRGEVPGGRAFGAEVSVLYWLVRNAGSSHASP